MTGAEGKERPPCSSAPNPPSQASGATRAPPPRSPARSLALNIAGTPRGEKLKAAAAATSEAKADALLVTALDEVAWLFNLRAADVPCCPVLQAYALVHTDGGAKCAELFVDETKVSADLGAELAAAGVAVRGYEEALGAVEQLSAGGSRVAFDPALVNFAMVGAAGERAVHLPSPLALPKAMKNEAELEGMLEAHLTDGAALANFFGWLEQVSLLGVFPLWARPKRRPRWKSCRRARGYAIKHSHSCMRSQSRLV